MQVNPLGVGEHGGGGGGGPGVHGLRLTPKSGRQQDTVSGHSGLESYENTSENALYKTHWYRPTLLLMDGCYDIALCNKKMKYTLPYNLEAF